MAILEEALEQIADQTIPGDVIFKLYDTYGFPVDLTNDIARERAETWIVGRDPIGRSSNDQDHAGQGGLQPDCWRAETTFWVTRRTWEGLYRDFSRRCSSRFAGGDQSGVVILDRTPIYGESGGQVGDFDQFDGGDGAVYDGTTCTNVTVTAGSIKVGDTVNAQIDATLRNKTRLNHSATHLFARSTAVEFRSILQKGSLVDSQRLRFDFSAETLARLHGEQVRVSTELMSMDDASLRALWRSLARKYGDEVKLTMGADRFSELQLVAPMSSTSVFTGSV